MPNPLALSRLVAHHLRSLGRAALVEVERLVTDPKRGFPARPEGLNKVTPTSSPAGRLLPNSPSNKGEW